MEQRRKEKIRNIPVLRFWESWDENERNAAVRIVGLCVGGLCIYAFIAMLSYLLHWKQDMSVITCPDMMDPSMEVGNIAGKTGAKFGKLLVCELFGLGSFAILAVLSAYVVKLFTEKWKVSMIKITALSLSAAFIFSLLLGHFSISVGLDHVFGSGLGGQIGSNVAHWGMERIGSIGSLMVILIMVVGWLFFCSKKFNIWLASIGRKGKEGGEKSERAGRISSEHSENQINSNNEPSIEQAEQETSSPSTENGANPIEQDDTTEPGIIEDKPDEATGELTIIQDDTLDGPVTSDLPNIDNRLDAQFGGLEHFQMPSLDLLSTPSNQEKVSSEELTRNSNRIRTTLRNYRIEISDVKAIQGPTVTLYKVYLAPGVQVAQIKRLQEDIGVSLGARGVRVVVLKDCVGIEVANDRSTIVSLKALLNSEQYRNNKAELPVAIGYTITQEVKVFDLADAPHLLVAGATKQGKSVGLNVLINSLLYSKHPSELKFIFIDPKRVEFSAYSALFHHYLAVMPNATNEKDEIEKAIIKTAKDAEIVLKALCTEMDNRYELISRARVSNIKDYNKMFKERRLNPNNGHNFLPYIVTIVDEYADLTMSAAGGSPEEKAAGRNISNFIIRLAQKGRAAGIHVVLATQRPSVDVISGLIKTNFPARIAFRVASKADSMTILDNSGADKLIGNGDMLFSAGIDLERVQCAYISSDEILKVNKSISEQIGLGRSYSIPYYLPEVDESPEGKENGGEIGALDSRFAEAARTIVLSQRGSTSDLQRKLGMGYARAGKVMDQLERAGIVGPQDGSKPRTVLVGDLESLNVILNNLGA